MLFVKIFLKLCSNAQGSIPPSVKVGVVHALETQQALFMVITMGFTANETTSYTILAMKLFISTYKALKIMYMYKYSKKGYSMKEGMFLLPILKTHTKAKY